MSERYRPGAPFRLSDQAPPPAKPNGNGTAERHPNHTEIDPALMKSVRQQNIPEWDFWRIVDNRHELSAWMHAHWADEVLSGQELIDELKNEER